MANTVNKIPSINLPLTNEQGVIHPIWYEFLRSFISSVGDSGGGSGGDNTVVAGAGILGTGAVGTVNVGQGEGILVGDNSVGVDIIHQVNAQAAPEDEILIADASDQSRMRKTSLRDVAALSPGTFPGGASGSMQYNNNGVFGGDNNFTTNGSGAVSVSGSLAVDSVTIDGSTISATAGNLVLNPVTVGQNVVADFTGNGSTGALRVSKASNSFDSRIELTNTIRGTSLAMLSDTTNVGVAAPNTIFMNTNNDLKWSIIGEDTPFNLNIVKGNPGTSIFTFNYANETSDVKTALLRNTASGITASGTQSQGNGALTAEVNEVSVVAIAGDTVTLPTALPGRKVWVINNGANSLQIFPASGDNLGAGVDTSILLTAGTNITFLAYDNTNWKQNV